MWTKSQQYHSDKFYFSDSKGIFMLLFMVLWFLLMVPSKMADNMFKLKIYPNLGMFGILSNLANNFLWLLVMTAI